MLFLMLKSSNALAEKNSLCFKKQKADIFISHFSSSQSHMILQKFKYANFDNKYANLLSIFQTAEQLI